MKILLDGNGKLMQDKNNSTSEMRKPADWMVPADDRILELFRDEGNMTPLALSRDGLVKRAPLARDYAGTRCRELYRYGMLEWIDKGLYRLSEVGHGYLAESLDASILVSHEDRTNPVASTREQNSR